MGALITVLFLAVAGWNTFVQFAARQQTSISSSCDVATARKIVTQSFGMWWKTVPGRGHDNYKARRGLHAPTLSISYEVAEGGGCHVDIWCSHFTTRYGLIHHAQLAWRKKRALAGALAREEAAREPAPVHPAIDGADQSGFGGANRIPAQKPGARIEAGSLPPRRPVLSAPPPLAASRPAVSSPPMAQARPSVVSPHQRPRGRHSRPDTGLEVPAAESRPAGTRARPARGTGPADGSAIMEAWLNELEAAQPQHGPLLRSTLDQVGNLPAVGDDGSIYTVSHDRFWFAAGYAKSYAGIQADNRRIAAVLAEAQAKEARDEPAMFRKEAEADFWESVKHWVDSAGPSRMAPEVMPAWLARFNPAWNPN